MFTLWVNIKFGVNFPFNTQRRNGWLTQTCLNIIISVRCIHLEIPDSVSIRPVNHTGPMMEGKEYQLLCEVQNIAPVQYLTLRWYRGPTEVYNHSFADLTSSSPVQVSSVLMIAPTKAENGVQYRCVAVLELGPEGPQPPPTVTSEPLNASVYCRSWCYSQF